ncbi:NAD(P)H-dependent FMN reductase [Maribacter vaceletii]|uniref:NAD(P)H-dependent FMN reductase n=1 Tax=Maribacter vaceletii TaxID=1206816 RepID=A0A495E9H0_9FLAO|nr:NAD(P)H-dependent oxidoreductase [Maribacter vaceletii]RKR13239.1 NAD(P)H-dependent FMN reductase [Maribacter vaceletii]
MATILAFAGSNSSESINYKLVKHTVSLAKEHSIQLLNLANFPFPMYSEDYEKENGFSNSLVEVKEDIQKADGIIISVNEHNGNPSAYFKNVLDWLSRLERNCFDGKKVFLMATSPGKRGAIGALSIIENSLPRMGAEVVVTFSLPEFYVNFDTKKGITNTELAKEHQDALHLFLSKLT